MGPGDLFPGTFTMDETRVLRYTESFSKRELIHSTMCAIDIINNIMMDKDKDSTRFLVFLSYCMKFLFLSKQKVTEAVTLFSVPVTSTTLMGLL